MRLITVSKKADAHTDGIWAVAWAGDTLITGGVDESVKQWKITSEESVALENTKVYEGSNLGVVSLAGASDRPWETVDQSTQKRAAVVSLDSVIRILDLEEKSVVCTIEQNPSEVWGVDISNDGQFLAAAAGTAGGVLVLSGKDFKETRQAMKSPVEKSTDSIYPQPFSQSVAIAPDCKKVVCGSMDGSVCLFDIEKKQVIQKYQGHGLPVRHVTISKDGQFLLTSSDDKHIGVFDLVGGTLITKLGGHESWVLGAIGTSEDVSTIVSCSADRTVKVWDLAQRTCLQTIGSEHSDGVWALAYNDKNNMIASVSDDSNIVLYNAT